MQFNTNTRIQILQEQRIVVLLQRQKQLQQPDNVRKTNHPNPLYHRHCIHYDPQQTPSIHQFSTSKLINHGSKNVLMEKKKECSSSPNTQTGTRRNTTGVGFIGKDKQRLSLENSVKSPYYESEKKANGNLFHQKSAMTKKKYTIQFSWFFWFC